MPPSNPSSTAPHTYVITRLLSTLMAMIANPLFANPNELLIAIKMETHPGNDEGRSSGSRSRSRSRSNSRSSSWDDRSRSRSRSTSSSSSIRSYISFSSRSEGGDEANALYPESYKRWWRTSRRSLKPASSPLSTLVAYGCSLEMIKTFLENHPETLTPHVLFDATYTPSAPGVFRYLLENLPEASFGQNNAKYKSRQDFANDLLFQLLLHSRQRRDIAQVEEDARFIVERNPVLGDQVWSGVLYSNCSVEFVEWMFSKFQSTDDFDMMYYFNGKSPRALNFNFISSIKNKRFDHDKMNLAISTIMPRLKEFKFFSNNPGGCLKEKTIHSLIPVIFKSTTLRSLDFTITPHKTSQEEDDTMATILSSVFTSAEFQQSQLEHVSLTLEEPYLGLIECVCKLPNLRKLTLNVDSDSEATVGIVTSLAFSLFRNGMLEELELRMPRCGSVPNFEMDLLEILNENYTLKRLSYSLKSSLKRVSVVTVNYGYESYRSASMRNTRKELTPKQKIDAYMLLNLCGRAKALHQETTQIDFIDLIHSVATKHPIPGTSYYFSLQESDICKVRFPLLLESVDKWLTS